MKHFLRQHIRLFIILAVVSLCWAGSWADEFRDTPKASADDGQEAYSSGYVNVDFNYIELVASFDRWGAAIRFPNLTIPQGATIDGARIKVWSFSGSWEHVYDTLACHDVDSATSLEAGGGTYDISERWVEATTAKCLWHKFIYETFTYDSTCDLSSSIQEVVDRPGWKSGNAIMILLKNKGVPDSSAFEIYSWDAPANVPESLIVYYTPAVAVDRYLPILK